MRLHRRESGSSLLELIVVLAIAAIGAAVAAASFTRTSEIANLRESSVDTAAAVRRKATSALGGSAGTFSIERDGLVRPGLTANPKYIPPPPGTEPANEIAFEGGTGNTHVDGRRAVASLVLCEEGHREFAYAIVCGTAGRVELRTYSDGEWRPFQ